MLRDLPIGRKFLLLGMLMLALCTPPSVVMLGRLLDALATTRTEMAGLPAVGSLLRLVRDTQVHRGASTGWLGGNSSLQGKREQQAIKLDKTLSEALADTAAYQGGRLTARRDAMQQQWQALRDDVPARRIDGPAAFARHTALIEQQLRLLGDVADRAGLVLEHEPGAYALVSAVVETLPKMTELMGQSRALGTLYLSRQAITEGERARLRQLMVQLGQLSAEAERQFANAQEADPDLAATVQGARQAADQALQAAMALVRQQVLDAASPTAPPMAFFNDITGHIDAQFTLSDQAFTSLQSHLQARTTRDLQLLWGTGAAMALLGTLAAWLLWMMTRSTLAAVASGQAAAEALASGNLQHVVQAGSNDEIGRMTRTLGDAMQSLAAMVREVQRSGDSVGTASAEIATGNADLSQRTEQTAANLQHAASALEQLHATVRHNADSAREAATLADRSSQVAERGGALVGQVVHTMQAISQRSDKIADIIGVIDGIAFQTNILALNAAVEAARAGEQGRGFAVVATEVRGLAQRSAAAAREIKTLIQGSVETVQAGTVLVGQAQQTMADIVRQVQQVSSLVGEIGTATAQQTEGIAQVNQTVNQLDQATQQNAALVEESAAAADSLREQAGGLVASVGRFRV